MQGREPWASPRVLATIAADESTAGRLTYWPALDGVRALSLIAILLYHSPFAWAKGGYLGVTVFFTLSGFLIGSLLLTEKKTSGGLRLRRFWGRRARRLAPAIAGLLLIVVILLLAGVLNRERSLFGDALATSAWVANWRFIFAGEPYAVFFGNPSPFQHMWSLAVEEQFYLLLPPIMLICFAGGGRHGRWRLGAVIGSAVVVSTVLCAFLFQPTATDRAYFGTDTRMAEPLVGVLLALLLVGRGGPRRFGPVARRALDAAGLLAFAALGWLVYGLGEYDPLLYHGGFLLTALLAAVIVTAATQTTALSWLLSRRPLVALGRISYGGYVYHWPIFLWLTPLRTGLDPVPLLAVRVLLTVAVAGLSYLALEQPIRRGRLSPAIAVPAWASSVTAFLVALALLGGSGSLLPKPAEAAGGSQSQAAGGAVPGAAPGEVGGPAPTTGSTRAAGGPNGSIAGGRGTVVGSAAAGPAPSPTPTPPHRIAFVGDSMSDGLAHAMAQWAQSHPGFQVYDDAIQGCPITRNGVERWPDGYERQVPDACGWWNDTSSTRYQNLVAFNPDLIVVQDGAMEMPDRQEPGWPAFFAPGDGVYDTWMVGEWRQAIADLTRGSRTKVMLLTAVCATFSGIQHWSDYTPGQISMRVASLNNDYSSLTSSNYVLQDLNQIVCPNGQFTQTVDGVPNARPDGYHLSTAAAYAVARDWLAPLCLQDLGLSA